MHNLKRAVLHSLRRCRHVGEQAQSCRSSNCLRVRKSSVLCEIAQILNIDNQFILFVSMGTVGLVDRQCEVSFMVFKKQSSATPESLR